VGKETAIETAMQNLLALLVVALAAGYLVRRGWRYFADRKSSVGCGSGCNGCASQNDSTMPKPLVTIDSLQRH
jgi:hypothetical protein